MSLDEIPYPRTTPFQRVVSITNAFGHVKGNYPNPSFNVVRKQLLNILDQYAVVMVALGADRFKIQQAIETLKIASEPRQPIELATFDIKDADDTITTIRTGLANLNVFSLSTHYLLGCDADDDTNAVLGLVLTRFITSDNDKRATIEYYAKRGVTNIIFQGEYPNMLAVSAEDQPSAPRNHILPVISVTAPNFVDI